MRSSCRRCCRRCCCCRQRYGRISWSNGRRPLFLLGWKKSCGFPVNPWRTVATAAAATCASATVTAASAATAVDDCQWRWRIAWCWERVGLLRQWRSFIVTNNGTTRCRSDNLDWKWHKKRKLFKHCCSAQRTRLWLQRARRRWRRCCQ